MTTYRKITIFECIGTGDNSGRSYLPLSSINSAIFDHKLITGYLNTLFPLNVSETQGVARVLEAIQATPGCFVLVGTSQGAQIMSEVYKRIKGTAREKDLVGAFFFANPAREEGHAFPGCNPVPTGHGVATAALRLSNTPELIWEFAKQGDPVATNSSDARGQRIENIYKILYSDFSGVMSLLSPDALMLVNILTGVIDNVAGAVDLGVNMAQYHSFVNTEDYKPIAGDPRSGNQIVVDQLNNVIGPKYANTYAIPAGLDLAVKDNKPTFFYAQGTSNIFDVAGVGIGGLGGLWDINSDPFPTLLDPSIWNYQRVTYAAAILPGSLSVSEGVADMVKRINATPGKFAIGGYSQGAVVASRVYDEIRYGSLQHRKNDLLAGVTFGNPVREKNHQWPGARSNAAFNIPGSTSGSHGVFPEALRLKNTESLWWDFAQDGDLFTTLGDNDWGQAYSALAGLLFTMTAPIVNLLQFAIENLGQFVSIVEVIGGILFGGAESWWQTGMSIHGLYGTLPPSGYPEGSKTSYQYAVEYLNKVGADWRATLTAPVPVQQLPPKGSPATTPVVQTPVSLGWLGQLLANGEAAVEAVLAPIIGATGSNPLVAELETLIKALPTTSTAAIESLTNVVNGLASGSMPLSTALTKISDLFVNGVTGTITTAAGTVTDLATWWNSQVNSWYQQVNVLVGQSQQWLQSLLTQGTTVVENTLGTLLTTGQHALESVVTQFANGLSAANNDLKGLLQSVVTAVNQGNATLHDAITSLDLIANSNLFTNAAAQLNTWWNQTVDTWFKNVEDIFGLPVASTPVDKQQVTPITDITDPSYTPLTYSIASMVTAPAAAIPASGPVRDVYDAITSRDPLAASKAAWEIAQVQQTPNTEIVVTIYDKTYNVVGECYDYKNLTYTFARNQVGTGTLILKHTDPLVEHVMKCHEEVIPIAIQNGSLRWSGRVEYVDYQFKEGQYDVTCYLTDDYQWFDRILCWPNFLLPIQTQFPQRSLFIGPAITCIKTLIAEQCFRLQSGIWEFVNNLGSGNLDWQSWFGTVLQSQGDPIKMLMTPIVVVPTNPLFDTSPWTSINGRMDKISTLVEQVVKDCGLVLTANLWMPGDPQPDGLFVPLRSPTILVDVKDMSGITGPTGTFIDGIVTEVVDLQHGVLGDTLSPFLNPANDYAPEGINIAPLLGVNFVKPWVLFHDHPRSGLREFHLTPHHPISHTIIGGGKSPKWVNDLINATLEWMIDAIEIAVGFTGIPNTLLDGTFDDIILAFQLIENSDRRIKLGPFGFSEHFQQTGASAYTLDEWFALQSAMWDTRGYHGIVCSFDNGFPYTIGKDLFVGSLASFAIMGKLYTDYVERITITDDVNSRVRAEVMIGDGKSHENPVTRIQRHLTKFQEAFNIVTMSTN